MFLNDDVLPIIRALACYLAEHPSACDTTAGIERWWLGPHLQARQSDVGLALSWLENHGLVARKSAADGRVRFKRYDAQPGLQERVAALLAAQVKSV